MIVDVVQLDADIGSDDIATGGSRALALVEGGNPPTEYLMFGPGVNETVKGPLLFDDDAAALVVAFYESRGRKRLAGDWEHDSMVPPEQRPPEYRGSPASHWFDLEVRPGPELWATNVKWTPSAFAQIQRGEYAHTSPVVRFQKATGRITAVMSSALTNDPATIGQPQLVAATADSTAALSAPTETQAMGMYKMADDVAGKVKGIVDGTHEDEKDMAGKLKACLSESYPAHFGEQKNTSDLDPAANAKMSEDQGKTEAAVLDVDPSNLPQNAAVHIKTGNIHDEGGRKSSAVSDEEKRQMTAWFNARGSLFREVQRLTGKSDPVEMVAVLTAQKHASEEVATLTAHAAKQSGAAFQSIVDKARSDKKLTPADCDGKTEAGKYVASLRDRGDEGIRALTAYVSALKPRVVTLDTSTKERETDRLDPKGEEVVILNATEIESCRKNGIKQEDMLRVKRERVAELKANGLAPRN